MILEITRCMSIMEVHSKSWRVGIHDLWTGGRPGQRKELTWMYISCIWHSFMMMYMCMMYAWCMPIRWTTSKITRHSPGWTQALHISTSFAQHKRNHFKKDMLSKPFNSPHMASTYGIQSRHDIMLHNAACYFCNLVDPINERTQTQ